MAALGVGIIAIGLLVALLIIFSTLAIELSSNVTGGVNTNDRRNFLKGIVGLGSAGIIVAFVGQSAVDSLQTAENTLRITTGGLYTLTDTVCEIYDTVILEDNARLTIEDGSCITITESN